MEMFLAFICAIYVIKCMLDCVKNYSKKQVEKKEREITLKHYKYLNDKYGENISDEALNSAIHRSLWGE